MPVPLLFTPMLGILAPKGLVGMRPEPYLVQYVNAPPNPARTTVFPLPAHVPGQAQTRRKITPPGAIFGRKRRARAVLLDSLKLYWN